MTPIAGHFYAVWGAFRQQWKANVSTGDDYIGIVANLPMVVAFAWIATRSDRADVLPYISVGLFFMTLWNVSQNRIRWSLANEAWIGTLEFSLLSRSPLMGVLLGKALAHTAWAAGPAALAFGVGLAIAGRAPQVQSVAGLLASAVAAAIGLLAIAFILAPFGVLAGRALDPIIAVRPLILVFSGFLYPVSLLPQPFETMARLLPTSWAMDGVIHAAQHGDPAQVPLDVAVSLAVSGVYMAVSYVLFRKVEERVRTTAALAG